MGSAFTQNRRLQRSESGSKELFEPTNDNRHFQAMVQPGGYLWPELRIGREADFQLQGEWDSFLNILGNRNRRRGHALPLGEVALHYVTDVEMRAMILKQHPQARSDRAEAKKIYRKISRETGAFMKSMGAEHHELMLDIGFGERAMELGKTAMKQPEAYIDARWLPADFQLKSSGPGKDFTGYAGNKIGIDLSANRELYDERKDILNHLKRSHNLDTSEIRRDWEPHAVVFRVHAHLNVDDIAMRYPETNLTPTSIIFDEPKVFFNEE